eukprot:scaffold16329_cov121-Isochrysis_galbana.AAC.16
MSSMHSGSCTAEIMRRSICATNTIFGQNLLHLGAAGGAAVAAARAGTNLARDVLERAGLSEDAEAGTLLRGQGKGGSGKAMPSRAHSYREGGGGLGRGSGEGEQPMALGRGVRRWWEDASSGDLHLAPPCRPPAPFTVPPPCSIHTAAPCSIHSAAPLRHSQCRPPAPFTAPPPCSIHSTAPLLHSQCRPLAPFTVPPPCYIHSPALLCSQCRPPPLTVTPPNRARRSRTKGRPDVPLGAVGAAK